MSVQNWLNDVTKAFQEKLKTTDKILPSTWPQLIRENWASGGGGGGGGALISIFHKGGKVGTPVPMSGMVEKIYFNTDLTLEEVIQTVEEANLTYVEGMMYPIFFSTSDDTTIILMYMAGQCQIVNGFNSDALVYFTNDPDAEFQGWNPDIDFTNGIDANSETTDLNAFGATHDKLTKLMSSTPFEVVEDSTEEIVLAGGYDGAPEYISDLNPKWNGKPGTVVPSTGLLDTVYINTDLDYDKMVELITSLNYATVEGNPIGIHSIVTTSKGTGIGIMKQGDTYSLIAVNSLSGDFNKGVLFAYNAPDNQEGIVEGWNNKIESITFNEELIESHPMANNPSGVENDKLTSLFSITPFEKTENNVIDLKKYIDDQKIPNKFYMSNDKSPGILDGTLTEYIKIGVPMIRSFAFMFHPNLQKIQTDALMVGAQAFLNCSYLSEVNLPNAIILSNSAFAGCESLSRVSFPNCQFLESYAFKGCNRLPSINLPLLRSVPSYAFSGCTRLSTASFPMCSSIGSSAFYNCVSLNALYLTNSTQIVTLYNSSVFTGAGITSSTGSIYVHANQYESYKSNTNWAYFADRFVSVNE